MISILISLVVSLAANAAENPYCESPVLNLQYQGQSFRSIFKISQKRIGKKDFVRFLYAGRAKLTDAEIGQTTAKLLQTFDRSLAGGKCPWDFDRVFVIYPGHILTVSHQDLKRIRPLWGRGVWERHLFDRLEEIPRKDARGA